MLFVDKQKKGWVRMPKSKSKAAASGKSKGDGRSGKVARGSHRGGKNLRGTKRSEFPTEESSDCRFVVLYPALHKTLT